LRRSWLVFIIPLEGCAQEERRGICAIQGAPKNLCVEAEVFLHNFGHPRRGRERFGVRGFLGLDFQSWESSNPKYPRTKTAGRSSSSHPSQNPETQPTFFREQLQARSIIPAKRRSTCRASGMRLQMHENFPSEQYKYRSLIESVFSAVKRKPSCRAPGRTLHTQSRQALLFDVAFNLDRLWLPVF
jgi:hypothetical protein